MVLEFLFSIVFSILDLISSPLAALNNISVSPEVLDTFKSYLNFVAYMVPVKRLLPILLIIIAVHGWRIVISLWKTILDAIPVA